jgi:hypothetical protein
MQRQFCRLGALICAVLFAGTFALAQSAPPVPPTPPGWDGAPSFAMKGGLGAYWNVHDHTAGIHAAAAHARGFKPVAIRNTFDDYPSRKESIYAYLGKGPSNPWTFPGFFERIARHNIADLSPSAGGIYVHDIEFNEMSSTLAWASDTSARKLSGAQSLDEFDKLYYRQWARWFTRPVEWTKQQYPTTPVGIFGPQPFFTEQWFIGEMTPEKIAYYHQPDLKLWRHIDSAVDFIAVQAYLPKAEPGAIYYIALHLEKNYERAQALSGKPIFAYDWLRYYHTDWTKADKLVDPHMVEAMAMVPYFSGAKAIVLWGHEDQVKGNDSLPYPQLPLYVRSLGRIAGLSEQIGRGKLVIDESAHVLWQARRPLVRRIESGASECVVLAVNPWQSDAAASTAEVTCAGTSYKLEMAGRHTTLAHIADGKLTLH